jgi:DNA-binding NtrC family response regulator
MTDNVSLGVILLVDDEPNVTEAMKRSLRREPFEFLTATSGKAALDILAARHIDVVVSDEQMPGMQGSQLLTIVRQKYPRAIRMILSGQASLQAAVRAINEGEVHRFFLKPCSPVDLILAVRQALTHHRLEEQSRRLLKKYQQQASLLARMPASAELLDVERDEHGALVLDDTEDDGDVNDLLAQMESALKRA